MRNKWSINYSSSWNQEKVMVLKCWNICL